jgi:thiamine kinase-like enzyme
METKMTRSDIDVDEYIDRLRDSYARFKEEFRNIISDSALVLLEQSIPDLYRIEKENIRRMKERNLTTVTHGDAHLGNFLYPDTLDGTAVIVDWQFWNIGIGTYDLRHLLGSALDNEMKKHQEELVRYYYQILFDGESVTYSWEACWADYRKGILDNLFMPVWQYTGFGWEPEKWMGTLKSAVANYYELGCGELEL